MCSFEKDLCLPSHLKAITFRKKQLQHVSLLKTLYTRKIYIWFLKIYVENMHLYSLKTRRRKHYNVSRIIGINDKLFMPNIILGAMFFILVIIQIELQHFFTESSIKLFIWVCALVVIQQLFSPSFWTFTCSFHLLLGWEGYYYNINNIKCVRLFLQDQYFPGSWRDLNSTGLQFYCIN